MYQDMNDIKIADHYSTHKSMVSIDKYPQNKFYGELDNIIVSVLETNVDDLKLSNLYA